MPASLRYDDAAVLILEEKQLMVELEEAPPLSNRHILVLVRVHWISLEGVS